MTEQHLLTQRTARFYTIGLPSDAVTDLWLVCHGYGQLARYFLRHFAPLDNGRTVIVAPEAFSRFYLDGFSGRVGATWMTKEDRLAEIDDQAAYLNLLLQTQLQQLPAHVRVTIVGFSQGGATVSRWLASGAAPVHRLILWAASFPEDIDFTSGKAAFTNLPVAIVYGTQDEFITPESLLKKQQLMADLSINPRIYTFEGSHTLHAETLLKVGAEL
ncbi:alpha/beta fold hydrolase [Pontibacter sp. H259]|uniref:alpha/beta hydrolase n=1 Tax=Pontibacter sp. H259 TaxID=3133421 RepID=UPI0030BD233F